MNPLFLVPLRFIMMFGCVSFLIANEPGGKSPLVTTPVTTGTEVFSKRTVHFLDNGVLRVLIADNGNVDSIKYLPPGQPGTPQENGTEMVSQSGKNFGNHTAIYYYWHPDGNWHGDFLGVATVGDTLDLACRRTYDPTRDKVPMDFETHYVLGPGNTGLYVYIVAHHPASYATYGDAKIDFIQMIWPGPHTATELLCENQYLDDTVKYGLSIDGVPQTRQGLMPTMEDDRQAKRESGYPKEIERYTTGVFAGQLNGKYSYNFDYPTLGTWGLASDKRPLGLWVVAGNHDYQNNGPTAAEYGGGYTGMLLFQPIVGHYDNVGLSVAADREWTKIYGPWLLYFNSEKTGVAAWQDAKNQVVAESRAWPYPWLKNAAYQPKTERGNVAGTLIINDPLRPGSSAAGAWVGLAAPDSGQENAADNWQFQADGYQYWTQADPEGKFTIPHIQTVSPDGQPAIYQLYAYTSGKSEKTGSTGEFSTGPIAVESGKITDLGTLTWNVPHRGRELVWEIGIPNRSASEYRHGDEYGKPGLWLQWKDEFTNPLHYQVAEKNWATALNFCHSVDKMTTSPWQWQLHFQLDRLESGTYWLNIAYASPNSVQIVRVNDDQPFSTFKPANAKPGATTFLRQGIHSKYSIAHVAIPSEKLRVGENVITLDHEVHSNRGAAHFMYDYINLEGPGL